MKRTGRVFGILLLLAGSCLFLYPDVSAWILEYRTMQYIEEFNEQFGTDSSNIQNNRQENAGFVPKEGDKRYQEILAYNKYIYETEQAGFKDMSSYALSPVSLQNPDTGGFGYIEIPAMGVKLPLYAGASDENMSKGAAILGHTSLPIGGINTNSVIAGHRGWRGSPYFLDIEKLSAGDRIYITNFWETLVYQVESADIIEPYDSDAVRIQEGRDMVTLVTCHPYMSHGRYRYVVYCTRLEEAAERPADNAADGSFHTITEGTVYESSQRWIDRESRLRKAGALSGAVMAFIAVCLCRRRNKKL